MTLPDQVQQQFETAQKLQNELYGQKEAPAPAENTPAVESPAPDVQPVAAVPETNVAPEVPAAQVQDDFKHKYDVLNGKYTKEVPRLYEQLKERDAQMQQLAERLAALEKPAEPVTDETLVTDKDNEDFGADLVDMAKRASREVFKQESKALVAALDARFKQLFDHLGKMQEKVVESEADKFWGEVTALVPDWHAVDADPSWFEFLDQRIPGTRKTRRQEAAEAIADRDPEPIKELVELWRGTTQQAAQAQKQQQTQAELQRQVAPSTANTSTPPTAQKFWTAQEYEYVFSQKAMHELSADKLGAMQADAQQALSEGRIRW